ncbi:chitin deacetylase [Mortierella sp. AM989]|nr:chitin deacetylase [Mortierella sp. AM989]
MAHVSSLPSGKHPSSKAPCRQLTIFATILLTMPMFAQMISAHPKPSTEQALKILSSPTSTVNDIDFHGVAIPFSDRLDSIDSDQTSDFHKVASAQTGSSRHAVSRVNLSIYPPKDKIPDVNSSQVKAWISEIDWTKVPNIPVAAGLPDIPHFPKCPPMNELDRSACWWSCAGCVAPDDIVTCPSQTAWGLTYDDGPSLATKDMVQYLNSQGLTATFFIVGSRVLEHADILKDQVAQGHHIGMHTWSHAGLTTLTNQEIVAEIKWTEKIIRDTTGLTMKYVRPPYGDTDNRVREILRQMGYTTVIWSKGWDTNDWRMLQGQIQEWEIVQNFTTALSNRTAIKSASGAPGGPITLEHDLTNATIALSKKLMPMAQTNGLKPMSIAHCLDDQTPYQHGSRLGPGGAVEKINNGEGKNSYKGMPGMEEQDFKTDGSKKVSSKVPNAKSETTLVSYSSISMTMGLIALVSTMAI